MDPETRIEAGEALRRTGYWVIANSTVGALVDSIVRDGFNLQTIEALDAYQTTALDDEASFRLLPSSLSPQLTNRERIDSQSAVLSTKTSESQCSAFIVPLARPRIISVS